MVFRMMQKGGSVTPERRPSATIEKKEEIKVEYFFGHNGDCQQNITLHYISYVDYINM